MVPNERGNNQYQNHLYFKVNGEICRLVQHGGEKNTFMAKYYWTREYKCPQCYVIYYECVICDDSGSNKK